MTTLLGDFRASAAAASCGVHEVAEEVGVARWCAELAGGGTLAVAPSVHRHAPSLHEALLATGAASVAGGPDAAEVVADAPVGVVVGQLAVAESGSVLVAEHDIPDRIVTLLVRHLVLVVAAVDLVESLDDVGRWLSEREGPVISETKPQVPARSLSIGVQGPEEVTVVVVG